MTVELKELIQSVDIVEYISQFVELEKRNDEWWGLSCFKDEKTPSFSVRKDPPVFFDYSSGIGGNLYTFVKYYFNCSSKEAIEILKKYTGFDGKLAEKPRSLSATNVCKRFRNIESTQTNKTKNVESVPQDCMNRFERRMDKIEVWLKEGISEESIDKFQVLYDGFSNRLVYPIRNLKGEIVNIGGRTLDSKWKENGQRKYTYFYKWGVMDVIYGLFENIDEIIKTKEVIIFEGCKSVLLADTWGIHNTAAILTSHLNPNQLKILARLGCRVVFALDKDVRIRDDHNIKKLKRYVNVEYIWDSGDVLGDKDSPVDKGQEVFEQLYRARLRYR